MKDAILESLRYDVDAMQYQYNVRRQKRVELAALPFSADSFKAYSIACALEDSAQRLLEIARGRLIKAA